MELGLAPALTASATEASWLITDLTDRWRGQVGNKAGRLTVKSGVTSGAAVSLVWLWKRSDSKCHYPKPTDSLSREEGTFTRSFYHVCL